MAISGGDGSIILTTKVDETGLKKGLGSMKKLGATASKAFLAIGAAAGAATVAITKMAVSVYADYEQLVGGVETLFKGSAQKVVDYANDAFATAGMSANQYMEQVIGISAMLIKSTGDTERAADIADMAIRDMADNVNKMGTDMARVQMAYQGFARQQYVLLDNLAIGYGGTKQEMERLLKDAQALTGVKYDINNLSDVYSAIHAIQEQLGITGTTAKEAEKTITGSANMMKSAWQNVLSAIAGGGDLDRAINNLVYSIQKYFENIVPAVERSLVGIGRLIEQVAPLLVQNVASALIQSIPSLINAIYQMIIGLAKGIWQGIKALFTGGSGSVTADIKTSVGGIATEAGNASTGIEELGDATEKAGKQAKKSLAAFDDLQIISSNLGEKIEIPEISTGSLNSPISESAINIKSEEAVQTTWLSQRLQELADAFSGLRNVDFTNLSHGLTIFKEPLHDLANIGWGGLIWGIENLITPLTKFTIEDGLPRFLESLSLSLRWLNSILAPAGKVINQFYQDFLKPISEYSADKFVRLWDSLNKNIEKFVNMIEQSEVWDDFQIIMSSIYDILEPIAKAAIDFITPILEFKMNNAFIDLELVFKSIEDLVGAIAALINGDFDDAWQHLKDLFLDNFVDYGKEKFQAFSDVVKEITGIDLAEWVKNAWESVKTFWAMHISPVFTKKWWEDLGKNCINGLISGFERGINGVIGAFESMINWIVDGLNRISFDIPDWLGGGSFGINLQRANLGRVSIPRLAQGAVIPPNREFLAVLGDQKHGTNIEAPLQTIVDAFNIALAQNGNVGGNTEVILEIDGREFGRAVVEQGNRENRRIGTRLVIA